MKAAETDGRTRTIVLSLLKNYYDEEIFNLLIRHFYDSDVAVSTAAIEASSSIGNEAAVPHLYKIIETGTDQQRAEAIKTLTAIKAPSAVDQLVQYYGILESTALKQAIISAVNQISPTHPSVEELNRRLLLNEDNDSASAQAAISGLIEAERFDVLADHAALTSSPVLETAFKRVTASTSQGAASFLDSFQGTAKELGPRVLGRYISALQLTLPPAKQAIVNEHLRGANREVIRSFLEALAEYEGRYAYPRQILKVLLLLPYVDPQTESLVGDVVEKLVRGVKRARSQLLSYFSLTVSTNIDTVFGKIQKQFLSIKGVRDRHYLLIVVLAKLMERYADKKLLDNVKNYFQASLLRRPEQLIAGLTQAVANGTEEEKNQLKNCLPFFQVKNARIRILISSQLACINLDRPNLVRRLNRLVRIAGNLKTRTATKKIGDILEFARQERIRFLEETTIVTLCQLSNRTTVDGFGQIVDNPGKNRVSLNGYLRGARFLPPRVMLPLIIRVLAAGELEAYSESLILDTLEAWDLSSHWTRIPGLLSILERGHLDDDKRLRLGSLLARNGDVGVLQTYIDLSHSEDPILKSIAAMALRNIARTRPETARDMLTDRLYALLDSGSRDVQIHALLGLIGLGDDYATRVFGDNVVSKDEGYVVGLLTELSPDAVNHDILGGLLDLLHSPLEPVRAAAGALVDKLARGPFSEEIRTRLLAIIKGESQLVETWPSQREIEIEELEQPGGALVGHTKVEYRFKRENAQVLTVFFIDMVGYTERSTFTDTSTLMGLIDAFTAIVVPDVESTGGIVVKKMGDGVLAVFKHPLKAALAALSIRRKVQRYNEFRVGKGKFNVRIGLNTGLVIRKSGDVFGEVVNIASRMETSANPGEILLTHATYREIKDHIVCTPLGGIQVKGKTDSIMAYTATEVLGGLDGLYGSLGDTPEGTDRQLEEIMLTETVAAPAFMFPEKAPLDSSVARTLQQIFVDITKAGEELTRDYHEENAFKRYIQQKWDELIHSIQSAPEPRARSSKSPQGFD